MRNFLSSETSLSRRSLPLTTTAIVPLLVGFVLFMGTIAFTVVQDNHPPLVKIISPRPHSVYPENTLIRYEVEVSDKEDGETKFQEIPPNEIFVEVRYFSDSLKAAQAGHAVRNDPAGLQIVKGSNCLNCHAFNAKLIGPSFYDISKRYPLTKSNVDTLSRRIVDGTSGIWGSTKMPTHPELTNTQATAIVNWILKSGADPAVSYYTGAEGSFRLSKPALSGAAAVPGKNQQEKKGVFLVVASYTDHGPGGRTDPAATNHAGQPLSNQPGQASKENPKQGLKGQDAILLRIE